MDKIFLKKIIEIGEKRLRKIVALIKTDYEKGKLQPTPAGHPQLAIRRPSYFLLVLNCIDTFPIALVGLVLNCCRT
jgi:hypothetical protein